MQLFIKFGEENLGEFFADFIIDEKILLELKKIWKISQNEIKQVLRYLKAADLRLAIIANFRHQRLEYKKVLN